MLKGRVLIIIIIVALLLGIIADYMAFNGMYLIAVSGEYIYYVYAAQSTIAAISATILTIVVNSFSERYYGFSIKEIVNFKNEYLKVSQIIPLALVSIVLSTYLLAMGMINTTVALISSIVILISSGSIYMWKLISEDAFCINRVFGEIDRVVKKNIIKETESLFVKLFKSLDYSINNYGASNIDNHLDLIASTMSTNGITDKLSILIDVELKNAFRIIRDSIGFIPAIDKVLKLYNSMDSKFSRFDRREILLMSLEKIQYLNDKELSSSSMIEISNGLENQNTLEDSDKILILYQYFKNVYLNEIISRKVRDALLEDLIRHVGNYRQSKENNYDKVKQKALLYIVKDFILVNKEVEDAKKILVNISKVLYSEGHTQSDKLFETIALIYLAIYLYSEHEKETITEGHRKQLKALIEVFEENIHTNRISFKLLIDIYFKDVVKALWNLSDDTYNTLSFLEYFPPQSGVKTIVWDKQSGIDFAINNYLLAHYEFPFPPYLMIDNWEERGDKRIYINKLLSCFNPDTKEIEKENFLIINNISEWIGQKDSLRVNVQNEMFEKYNKDMANLEKEDMSKVTDYVLEVSEINDELRNQFEQQDFFGFNDSIDFDDSKLMSFRPTICNLLYDNSTQNVSLKIIRYFERFLNDQIKQNLPEVKISFDLCGVKSLLELLNNKRLVMRNYTYVDDWALSNDVRNSQEYKELVNIINSIDMKSTKPINSRLFLSDSFKYNFKIMSYRHKTLTEEECSIYVENFKVADGLYKFNHAYYNKSKAMEIIIQGYRKEIVSFRFISSLNSDSGVRIMV